MDRNNNSSKLRDSDMIESTCAPHAQRTKHNPQSTIHETRNTHHDLVVLGLRRLGHLDDGHAQVAADPEGDEEAD